MAGISITIDGMMPWNGMIGGEVGFPILLSVIDISMGKYGMIDSGDKTYTIEHRTETQRFIVPTENKVEM